MKKILSLDALRAAAERSRRAGLRWVHCHGCFDVVHGGHLRYLEQARRAGDRLVVTLTSDAAIYKDDGTRPVVPQELRAEALAALELVDYVAIVDAPTALPAIDAVAPAIYVKGQEYADSLHPGFVVERERVEALGGSVQFASDPAVFSTTELLSTSSRVGGDPRLGPRVRFALSCQRWGVTRARLLEVLAQARGRKIAVLGDVTLDRFVSGERQPEAVDGVPRFRARRERLAPGGAARVALDIARLGAQPLLLTRLASCLDSQRLTRELRKAGVEVLALATCDRLPRRTWYLAGNRPLLCVNEGVALGAGASAGGECESAVGCAMESATALVLVDPGFGCLDTPAAVSVVDQARQAGLPRIGGELAEARAAGRGGFTLRVVSEQRLRAYADDFSRPLPSVAEEFMRKSSLEKMLVEPERGGVMLFGWNRGDLPASPVVSLEADHIPPLSLGYPEAGAREEPLLGACAVGESLGLSLQMLGCWAVSCASSWGVPGVEAAALRSSSHAGVVP